jgi:hypothetical protein
MVADVTSGADPVMLDTGALEAGFPPVFTDAGQIIVEGRIIYIGQGAMPADANTPYRSEVKSIALEAGAAPETLAAFEWGTGCGGGASIPTFWRYWEETGFGGSPQVLKMTSFGLLHSTNCSGGGLAMLNLETGQDTKIGPEFLTEGSQPTDAPLARVALSPDGKTAAAVRVYYATPGEQPPTTFALALVDLATLNVTNVTTPVQPDQVAWSADGATLFYSTQENPVNLIDNLTPEEKEKIGPIVGTVQNNEVVPVWSYTATIHHLNPATGEDTVIYSADAFAIGRMSATPDGQALIASQVANAGDWLAATLSGELSAETDPDGSMARALVPVTLLRIPVNANDAPTVIVENLAQLTLRPGERNRPDSDAR